ncbi:hypothetical protein IFM89_011346 [Coptis chinensis]|uniref:Uncharacterized protein n=1 Tax=Coptis chinensis TaxID=261450 RepID=A0A835HJX7_9MAGN|nr:hypothetical protein IFM89_011346 [Coptis chinensis]
MCKGALSLVFELEWRSILRKKQGLNATSNKSTSDVVVRILTQEGRMNGCIVTPCSRKKTKYFADRPSRIGPRARSWTPRIASVEV